MRRLEREEAARKQKEDNERKYNLICRTVSYLQDRITEAATLDL